MDSAFVVKHTFLDFVGPKNELEVTADVPKGRARSYSDSIVDWSTTDSEVDRSSKHRLSSKCVCTSGSTTAGSLPGTPPPEGTDLSSGEELCRTRPRLNTEPICQQRVLEALVKNENLKTEIPSVVLEEIVADKAKDAGVDMWAFKDSPEFVPNPIAQPLVQQPIGCPSAMPMYFLSVNPDGTQVLVPAPNLPTWGNVLSQPPTVTPKAKIGTPVKLGALLADDTNSESLEKRAAALSAYAAEVRAEARRAKAAASAARRKQGSDFQTRQRAATEGLEDLAMDGSFESYSARGFEAPFDDREDFEGDDRTTLMFRNLPNNYTRSGLLEMLDSEGFHGTYSFVYVPTDFKNFAGFGYAFVNFAKHEGAKRAKKHFEGFSKWSVPSRKVCDVVWSGPVQGLEAHTERYRNSPVMHDSVPDEYKPVVFVDGKRVRFPPPTKRIRPPRVRHSIAAEPGSCGGMAAPERRSRARSDMPFINTS